MKAFNSYGSRCNGCNEYAEFCSCNVDSNGELVQVHKPGNKNIQDIDYLGVPYDDDE